MMTMCRRRRRRRAQGAWKRFIRPSFLQEPGATVLVAGATGGVGQLVAAKLLDVSAAGCCWQVSFQL